MESRRDRDPLSRTINIGPEAPVAEPKNLAEELGHEPSEFESQLLAHPGDKDGQKKLAVELMLDQASYNVVNLSQVKNRESQKRINELAVEYRDITTPPKNDAERSERRKRQKEIAAEVKTIMDKAFDEE